MKFRKIKKAAIIFCISVILICPQHTVVWASKTDTTAEKQEEAVETFIRDFYEAYNEQNIDKMQEQLEDCSQSRMYIARCRALFACGFRGYDNLEIKVYPLEEKDFWLATVVYDSFFEGIDIGLPGAETVLVQRQEDGGWLMLKDYDSADLYEEVVQITTSDEIVELMNEQNAKLNDIFVENPAIWEWFSELYNELTAKLTDSFLQDPEKTPSSDTYTVKQGDCLWNIAKKELGDGRRWGEVYEANKNVIGDNPNLILIGMQLQL